MMRPAIPAVMAIAVMLMLASPQLLRADLWDFSQGTLVTNWSPTKGDIRNMFGGNYGPVFCGPAGTHMLFADNYPRGTVHFVEWQTPAPITLRSFSLSANHDGLPANALLRGFSSFRLFAADPDTGEFDNMLYEIALSNPYGDTPQPEFTYMNRNPGFAHPSMSLALTANVLATTAQRFRAEFVQFGPGNSYASGPRIQELDGFDTYYPGRPYPQLSAPIAVNDYYDVPRNGVLSVSAEEGLLANDIKDPRADELIAPLENVFGPNHGQLDFYTDAHFTYTPHANYSGPDVFVYKAYDGSKQSKYGVVYLTVVPEPSTLALLAMGAIGLGVFARRKNPTKGT